MKKRMTWVEGEGESLLPLQHLCPVGTCLMDTTITIHPTSFTIIIISTLTSTTDLLRGHLRCSEDSHNTYPHSKCLSSVFSSFSLSSHCPPILTLPFSPSLTLLPSLFPSSPTLFFPFCLSCHFCLSPSPSPFLPLSPSPLPSLSLTLPFLHPPLPPSLSPPQISQKKL